jgi:hypothetical protein
MTLQKSRNDLKLLGASWVARSKAHAQDPQILGATAGSTWRSEFIQLWFHAFVDYG